MSRYYRSFLEESGAPFSYILDTYSGATAGYSLRKLSSTYSGNCIRVRRSSDNAEQDIGFVSNALDTTSLLTFVGSGNGAVTTWYDQSGSGNNAINATAVTQPIIINAGTLVVIDSQVAVDCYNKVLNNSTIINTTQSTFIAYKNETTLNFSTFLLPFSLVNTAAYLAATSSGSGAIPYDGFTAPVGYYANDSLITATRGSLYTNFVTGTKKIVSIIGGGVATSGRTLQYDSPLIGNYKLFEVIIYPSNKATDRSAINTNINTYYSIY